MNILFLTQFLSTKGGGEYLFSLTASALAEKGHKIWIITHKIENEDYSHFHKNIRIFFVSSVRYEGGLPPSFKDNMMFVFQAIIKGIQLMKKEKIDLIHSNSFSPALASSILSSITGCPHITTMWDVFSLCGKDYWTRWADQKGVSRLHAFLGPRFEKLILRMRHVAIQTISEVSKNDLIKFGATKPIHVIKPTIIKNTYKKNIENDLQFVYVGRLVFYKNLETVLRAFSIVKNSYEKIQLKIIGDGPYKENLMNLTKELELDNNVEFCGYVGEDEKYKIISASTAMVFPSLCEGFGLVILESFSCGRPVIVSNVRPLSDIIEDKKDGFVIEAKNEKKWAEAVIYLIKNTDEALKMGQEGKKKLETQYDQETMISEIESMYRQVISV